MTVVGPLIVARRFVLFFFNISKAFDFVPHLPLLRKLADVNLDPYIQKWICSYLSSREQYVVVNRAQSSFYQSFKEYQKALSLVDCFS